jgi:hypothetical protein
VSYVVFSYREPPPPYRGPTTNVPYPGWGVQPHAAGPARVGVGAIVPAATLTTLKKAAAVSPPSEEAEGLPWWMWLVVPMALGGGLLFAYDQGWLGGKKETG